MPIVYKDLVQVRCGYVCDRCGDGQYHPTGVAYLSFPPQYPHICDNCGDKRLFGETYPASAGFFIEGPKVTDNQVEAEIQAKGLSAPRVTPADIEANIKSEHYFTAEQGAAMATADATGEVAHPQPPELRLLTFCVLVLKNGYTVTGESACASPENFDAALGRKIARQSAVQKIWPLMGYALKQQLHEAQ